MHETVPFQMRLTGDLADTHKFQGYDGYMAMAGFAWTLSLVTNYAVTGEIRHKGDFPGRRLVHARAPQAGSVLVEMVSLLTSDPVQIFGGVAAGVGAGGLLTALVSRVINQNIGDEDPNSDRILGRFMDSRGGDIEALTAMAESPIRQTLKIIGNGVEEIYVSSGFNIINSFNEETKEYVNQNVIDNVEKMGDFSISAFNVNSGHGSVFDRKIGRVVPFSMGADVLEGNKRKFSWGLDQYASGKSGKLRLKYTRLLNMDGRPKRYIVLSASRVPG
ncbi:hypothetical protein [Alloyangia pacifica]|uniref:DUF7946 domain-containing protein n=1 Tax=Alloyangia pacifica TaxID=311180 RepID=UPI001CD6D19E|nr:hypothetical protein [Alloyangia pacifica]MCA0996846.1 hypothetical protein [Alloyangia pacifica]